MNFCAIFSHDYLFQIEMIPVGCFYCKFVVIEFMDHIYLGIEASDMSSLLEQFLEYEKGEVQYYQFTDFLCV